MNEIEFFLSQTWSTERLQEQSRKAHHFIEQFHLLLSDKLNISTIEIHELLYTSEYSILSAIEDCKKRLEEIPKSIDPSFDFNLAEYIKTYAHLSMNNDLELRRYLFTLVASSQGKVVNLASNTDPKKTDVIEYISQQGLDQYIANKKEYFQKFIDLIYLILSKLIGFISSKKNIHFINLDLTKWRQLSSFNFIKIEPPSISLHVSLEERESFQSEIKDQFYQLTSLKNYEEQEIELLLNLLVAHMPATLIQIQEFETIIKKEENRLQSIGVNTLISQGNFYREQCKPMLIAARRLKIPLVEIQNGGFPIFDEGEEIIKNRFSLPRTYLTWAPSHNLPNHIKSMPFPNPRFRNIQSLKINKNSTLKILYTPIALSHLYNSELFSSFLPEHMQDHREMIHQSFQSLEGMKVEVTFKVKAFGNSLFGNYEYLTFPNLDALPFSFKLSTEGTSSQYFSHNHLHFTDGLSTTFSESLACQIPTIGFWNKKALVPYENFKEIYKRMKELKIIIEEPKDLPLAIQNYTENPNYWKTKEVQDIVEEYCHALANKHHNWRKKIEEVII